MWMSASQKSSKYLLWVASIKRIKLNYRAEAYELKIKQAQ